MGVWFASIAENGPNAFDFSVSNVEGQQIVRTGPNGSVTVDQLPPGPITISEGYLAQQALIAVSCTNDPTAGWEHMHVGSGNAISRVLTQGDIVCCESNLRDLESDSPVHPLTFSGSDGAVGVQLLAGELRSCIWYVIPKPL